MASTVLFMRVRFSFRLDMAASDMSSYVLLEIAQIEVPINAKISTTTIART